MTDWEKGLKKPLFTWQKECLDIWFDHQGQGVVNVVTGAGKTILALGAIARLESVFSEQAATLKIKIIVPKIFLAHQWAKSLTEDLAITKDNIGIYSGLHKDPPSRKYMIYVINSARTTLARQILADYNQGDSIFLIADECHHYGSPENSRIFDFIGQIPVQEQIPTPGQIPRYFALGLSATPEPTTVNKNLQLALGPEIYKYSYLEAISAKVIRTFVVFQVRLSFTREEACQYQDFSEQLTQVRTTLLQRRPDLMHLSRPIFFARLEQLAQSADDDDAFLARRLLGLAYKRKEVVYMAEARASCVSSLVAQLPITAKILIFCERIASADVMYEQLQHLFPGQVGRYHSKIDERSRKRTLHRYQEEQIRILVSCRALDEGLNVPSSDIGIIASSTGVTRQRIQRTGRILRQSGLKQTAKLYYLYIGSSNEETDLLKEISHDFTGTVPVLDLEYDQDKQIFVHTAYQMLTDQVISYTKRKGWSDHIIAEIRKHLERGKLGCDWWRSEQDCLLHIQNASSRTEKNYWVSMCLLVRASLGRLKIRPF